MWFLRNSWELGKHIILDVRNCSGWGARVTMSRMSPLLFLEFYSGLVSHGAGVDWFSRHCIDVLVAAFSASPVVLRHIANRTFLFSGTGA